MELSLLVLEVINFAYVGLLPFIFFRKDGTWNFMWCLTALPYVIGPAIAIAGYMGYLEAQVNLNFLAPLAVVMFAFSIAFISATISIHRVPLSLWHQDNDAPASIVTYGPYAKVRHPFYTSFIICLLASVIVFPHVLSVALALYTVIMLNVTAAKEEVKLSNSDFGEEYKAYIKKTGRFFPSLMA